MAVEFHPLAKIFPLLEGEDFAAFVADIAANGLREAITIHEGLILDGRNRFRACQKLGIVPHTRNLNGDDPIDFVMSENMHRRHMTVGQKAWAAQQVANLREGRPSKDTAQNCAVSQEEAAKLFRVSRRSVQAAAFVAQHGNDQDKDDVASGRFTAGRVVERIKVRSLAPEAKEKKSARDKKRREPAKRARREASVIKTIIIASQQLEAAARTLEQIEMIPDLGERLHDVIQNLRCAYAATGRFARRLEQGSKDV